MRNESKNWIDLAKTDYSDSLYLFKAARHPNAVYLVCQAVEKLLKAAITELDKDAPPKTHHLHKLAQLSELGFSDEQLEAMKGLNRHYRRIRYRDIAQTSYNTKEKVEPIINSVSKLYLWIFQVLNNH